MSIEKTSFVFESLLDEFVYQPLHPIWPLLPKIDTHTFFSNIATIALTTHRVNHQAAYSTIAYTILIRYVEKIRPTSYKVILDYLRFCKMQAGAKRDSLKFMNKRIDSNMRIRNPTVGTNWILEPGVRIGLFGIEWSRTSLSLEIAPPHKEKRERHWLLVATHLRSSPLSMNNDLGRAFSNIPPSNIASHNSNSGHRALGSKAALNLEPHELFLSQAISRRLICARF